MTKKTIYHRLLKCYHFTYEKSCLFILIDKIDDKKELEKEIKYETKANGLRSKKEKKIRVCEK